MWNCQQAGSIVRKFGVSIDPLRLLGPFLFALPNSMNSVPNSVTRIPCGRDASDLSASPCSAAQSVLLVERPQWNPRVQVRGALGWHVEVGWFIELRRPQHRPQPGWHELKRVRNSCIITWLRGEAEIAKLFVIRGSGVQAPPPAPLQNKSSDFQRALLVTLDSFEGGCGLLTALQEELSGGSDHKTCRPSAHTHGSGIIIHCDE